MSVGINCSNPLPEVVIPFSADNLHMHMNRYRQPSYGQLAKGGFLLGLGMFLLGAGGEWAVHATIIHVPAWENALFLDMEGIGILLFLFSPFVFGIFLPLVDG